MESLGRLTPATIDVLRVQLRLTRSYIGGNISHDASHIPHMVATPTTELGRKPDVGADQFTFPHPMPLLLFTNKH